jgi:hypothetical protein
MNKTKEAVKAQLREQWEKACCGYLCELLRMWECDACYGRWVRDEVGGVYDYGCGVFTISMDDIIYCVENDVPESQYIKWQEYCCDAAEFSFDQPNLRSWVKGCPRTSELMFKKLREMRKVMLDAVEQERERIKKAYETDIELLNK